MLSHLGFTPQGDVLSPFALMMLQLLPHEEGRDQLLLNWQQITPVTDANSLIICRHLLLAHCFCSKESLNLPLQKMLRETDPSSSKCRNAGLCQAASSAVFQIHHLLMLGNRCMLTENGTCSAIPHWKSHCIYSFRVADTFSLCKCWTEEVVVPPLCFVSIL